MRCSTFPLVRGWRACGGLDGYKVKALKGESVNAASTFIPCHSEPFGFAQDRLREESLIILHVLNENSGCFQPSHKASAFVRSAQHDIR